MQYRNKLTLQAFVFIFNRDLDQNMEPIVGGLFRPEFRDIFRLRPQRLGTIMLRNLELTERRFGVVRKRCIDLIECGEIWC